MRQDRNFVAWLENGQVWVDEPDWVTGQMREPNDPAERTQFRVNLVEVAVSI